MTDSKFLKPELYKDYVIIFTRSGFGVFGEVYDLSMKAVGNNNSTNKPNCFKYIKNQIDGGMY